MEWGEVEEATDLEYQEQLAVGLADVGLEEEGPLRVHQGHLACHCDRRGDTRLCEAMCWC